jgi:plastocyanin
MLSAEDALPAHRSRQLALCLGAVAAGAGLAVVVASAGADEPMTASITAKDPYSFDNGTGGSSVSIAKGGTVTFSYPTGGSSHNVVFDTAQPTSCMNMPATFSPAPWSGSCTFDSYGTYAFHCGLHGSLMRGKVEVPDPNAPPTDTTQPPTDTGGQPPGGGEPPGGELAAPAVKVAGAQRGVVVRGSVTTPAGPSSISVSALVARGALASRARLVKIGSVRKRSTGTGRTSFALRVNRAARRALSRRHRLAVTLRIAVTPDAGAAFKKTVKVVLRERR